MGDAANFSNKQGVFLCGDDQLDVNEVAEYVNLVVLAEIYEGSQ